MTSRKINRVGSSTLTVSLPSKWAKEHGLKPGSEVDVVEDGPTIIVRTHGFIDTPKRAEIHLKKGQGFMRRYFNVMYRDGYDEIELTSEDPIDMAKVKKAASELLGFELVESQPRRVVVKNIATPNVAEFDNLFRRLFLLTISMAESTLQDMRSGGADHAKEVADLEVTSNKFTICCHRMLVKSDIKNRVWTLNLYQFAGELEEIADHLKRVCLTLGEHPVKVSKHVADAFETCFLLLRELYDAFYKPDTGKITHLVRSRNKAFEQAYSLLAKRGLSGADGQIAGVLLGILASIKAIETEMYHI